MATYRTSDLVKVGDLMFPAFKYESGMQHQPSGIVAAVSSGRNRRGQAMIILDLEDGRTFIYRTDERVFCETPPADTPHP